MQPLSPLLRRVYLVIFIILFCSIIPLAIFYADGWRYQPGYGFVRTGGIFISVPYPDATVSVNGIVIGESGFLEHSFYQGDLAPSAYIVHVDREGYRPWDRLLVVEEQLVTDTRTILIPEEIMATKLGLIATSTPQASTSTRMLARSLYNEYLALFAATTTASTTIPIDEADGVGLFLNKGKLVARWIQKNAFPPSHFCERPSVCANEIIIEETQSVTAARFFRSGVVYATKEGRIVFAEIDVRETPLNIPLYTAKGTDFRIIDDTLVVKTGSILYQIEL